MEAESAEDNGNGMTVLLVCIVGFFLEFGLTAHHAL